MHACIHVQVRYIGTDIIITEYVYSAVNVNSSPLPVQSGFCALPRVLSQWRVPGSSCWTGAQTGTMVDG